MTNRLAAVLMVLAIASPASAEPTLRWLPEISAVALDSLRTLSIVLDDTVDVRAVEVYVEYDPTLVSSASGGPGAMFTGFGLFRGFEEVDPANPGLWHGYCVILGATDWATGPGELFRWTVRGEAEGICSIAATEFTLLPPGGGSYPDATLAPTALAVKIYASAAPPGVPESRRLQAQPNPFNPRTTIRFELLEAGPVRLDVFDVAGRLVRTLVDTRLPQGSHEATWDGRDTSGRAVGSGNYLARMVCCDRVETARMALVQ